MEIGGGYTLTEEQVNAWQSSFPGEYQDYVEEGLFDEDTFTFLDEPPFWMIDGNPNNGPFDFGTGSSGEEIHY